MPTYITLLRFRNIPCAPLLVLIILPIWRMRLRRFGSSATARQLDGRPLLDGRPFLYGCSSSQFRFEVVSRVQGDLLTLIEAV
jgi:hypothetical protein